jgi:hypothetical protein
MSQNKPYRIDIYDYHERIIKSCVSWDLYKTPYQMFLTTGSFYENN